jgi:multidrug efflux pump subunit AcrA (membrane-fusion protein)
VPARSSLSIAIVAALVTSLVSTACLVAPTSVASDRPTAGGTTVRTVRASRADLAGVLNYGAELKAKSGAVVTARIPGRLERVHVDVGSAVRQGDTLAELDRPTLEAQVVQAQANLAGAEARLAGLQAGTDPEARSEAEARLRAARARLTGLEALPRSETIPQLVQNVRDARRRVEELESHRADAVAQAEARLLAARGRLDQALTAQAGPPASPTPVDINLIQQARGEVLRAEEDLARARRPVTTEEIAGARQELARAEDELLAARMTVGPSDIEEAQANVEAAEARLRGASTQVAPATIRAAETAVDYAWAALELARLQLREATITAPIHGLVVEIHQPPAAAVGAGAPIVTLQPPEFEVVLAVEERNLGYIHVGQGVSIGIDAYPGDAFGGTIRSVSPAIDVRARTAVTRIDVLDPRGKLKSGMFANVVIPAVRRQAALVIPREALLPGPETVVMQVIDGRARRQPVLVGVGDGKSIEILQGLAEGSEVVLSPLAILEGDVVVGR